MPSPTSLPPRDLEIRVAVRRLADQRRDFAHVLDRYYNAIYLRALHSSEAPSAETAESLERDFGAAFERFKVMLSKARLSVVLSSPQNDD